MKASAIWAAASLLAASLGVSGSCLAAEGGTPAKSMAAVEALIGKAIPSAQLGQERARGLAVNLDGSSLNNGSSTGNRVVNSPITGSIVNDNSISNNVGITSVLQNMGNNSVVQSSTTINITVH